MPKAPKKDYPSDAVEREDMEKSDSWETDQETRSYYYDDAHGYETYVPDCDDEQSTEAAKKPDENRPA